MKKHNFFITVGYVAITLSVIAIVVGFLAANRMFRDEVFEGDRAAAFIADHPTLLEQWKECGLDRNESRVVRLVAARGVLQSGARFCATVRVAPETIDHVTSRLPPGDERRLLDKALGLDITGRQFEISPCVGHDGPEVILTVPENQTEVVVYYAYAGDG